jgi:hypothetical protein
VSLGIGGLYWTNRLRDGILPRRRKDGNTVRILLTGAWFFSDRVITADQSRALLAVEVGQRYSTMVFSRVGSDGSPVHEPTHRQRAGLFLFMILLSLPRVVWYSTTTVPADQAATNPLPLRSGANEPESLRDLEYVLDESTARPSAPTPNTDETAARAGADQLLV